MTKADTIPPEDFAKLKKQLETFERTLPVFEEMASCANLTKLSLAKKATLINDFKLIHDLSYDLMKNYVRLTTNNTKKTDKQIIKIIVKDRLLSPHEEVIWNDAISERKLSESSDQTNISNRLVKFICEKFYPSVSDFCIVFRVSVIHKLAIF